jgi:hypothetical protein
MKMRKKVKRERSLSLQLNHPGNRPETAQCWLVTAAVVASYPTFKKVKIKILKSY